MCGIVAVLSRNASEKAMKLLESQEHRGTASTGLCWVNNGEIKILKDTLSPREFSVKYRSKIKSISVDLIMGHNRLPSVGPVNIQNSHPFLSCNKEFSLVHNGSEDLDIMGNFLKKKGHKILGETDSEIILHMFEELYEKENKNMVLSIKNLSKIIKVNSYGSVIIMTKEGDIWGYGKSIVIIRDFSGVYIASDMKSLSGLFDGQRKYVYEIQPETIFNLNKNGIKFYGNYNVNRKVVRDGIFSFFFREKKYSKYDDFGLIKNEDELDLFENENILGDDEIVKI